MADTTHTPDTSTHNFPYTTYPCDNVRSFERRNFTTLDAAVAYGKSTGQPWAVCLPSGAIAAVYYQ
jgi:hypothetical protein